MGKPGLGIFSARRKSVGNVIDAEADTTAYSNTSPPAESSGFRVLNRSDIERAKQEKLEAAAKPAEKGSKFGRFSGFGALGNKARTQSIDDDSPSSSKRDSKSSSGTQSFTSRPYHGAHYGGSSSTLPSSAESDPNDNIFSSVPPRPHAAQQHSSPGALSMGGMKKSLPAIPTGAPGRYYSSPQEDIVPTPMAARGRALTTSSYASTAIPPKLDADLSFGTGFDDVFSSLERTDSPELASGNQSPGRSLLSARRPFTAEPINVDRKLEVEPPPKSWNSRNSGEHLIPSPAQSPPLPDNPSPPPPVPPHNFRQYAPVASDSPELRGSDAFDDEDARLIRQSVASRKSTLSNSPEQNFYKSSSSHSFHTPLTSRPASNNTTPKAVLRPAANLPDHDEDNIFAPAKPTPVRKPAAPVQKENVPPPSAPGDPGRKVMTAAEFKAQQRNQLTHSGDDSSDEDDYEDEEDAIQKREAEMKAARQRQQMSIAREHMRRSTTAPADPKDVPDIGPLSNGFPSETSLQAEDWSDEDVPLGVLAQHGFPSKTRPPAQPANPMPSYFRDSTPMIDRPASTGALGNRAPGYRPPFARNLPDDPYASMIGGGIVRQPMRESMGFSNRGPSSVYGGDSGSVYGSAGGYNPEPQFTSLVDQIQMRDMAKQKYMGGASSKKPEGGPFTGALSGHMNAAQQDRNSTRMSTMGVPGMNGMNGANGMQQMNGTNGMHQMNGTNGMHGMMPGMPGSPGAMMNPMMMGGGMPMMGMGMNQMPYPMYQQNELMMQQMYQQMLQMQAQQNAMFGGQQQMQQPPQQQFDPRMSMAHSNPSFLNVNNAAQRPMSMMNGATPQNRPMSTFAPQSGGLQSGMNPNQGYTPSIAPSERSNIGLSARYRPVVTGNGMVPDNHSMVSSMTLQASGGAVDNKNKTVKGILKKPQMTVREEDEDDWGKLAARKSKFVKSSNSMDSGPGLKEMMKGIDGY